MKKKTAVVVIGGNELDLSLTARRVREGAKAGYDIGDIDEGPVVNMFIDPVCLGETVWANYHDRIEAAGIANDEDEFLDLVDNELRPALEVGMKEAVRGFFTWGASIVDAMTEQIAKIPEMVQKKLKQSGQASGDMPESSESIQGHSPLDS